MAIYQLAKLCEAPCFYINLSVYLIMYLLNHLAKLFAISATVLFYPLIKVAEL